MSARTTGLGPDVLGPDARGADALGSDLLGSAAAALRDLTVGPDSLRDPAAEATRRRVMASLGERRSGHRRRLAFAVFAFALSTATLSWAASTGRLTKVLRKLHIVDAAPVEPAVSPPADPRDGLRRKRAARPEVPSVATLPPPPPSSASASASASVPASASAPASASRSASSAPATPARVAAATAQTADTSSTAVSRPVATVVDPDTRSYRRAHALHFHGGAAADTLAAWDAYLATFPRGRFAAEAQYNRAITLVRLDRKTEARAALAPFAAGEIDGGYRRDEATALREALARE